MRKSSIALSVAVHEEDREYLELLAAALKLKLERDEVISEVVVLKTVHDAS